MHRVSPALSWAARWLCVCAPVVAAASCATASLDSPSDRQSEAGGLGGNGVSLGGGSSGETAAEGGAASGAASGGARSGSGSAGSGGSMAGAGTSSGGSMAGAGTSSGGGGTSGAGTSGAGTSGAGTSTAGAGNTAGAGGGTKCVLEICNGVDDDCDGVIDDGCPSMFVRGAATAGMTIGDSTGGGPYSAACANDELLVGLQVGFSNWLDQVDAKCQQFSLAVDKTAVPYKYSVKLGSSHLLAPFPSTTSDTTQVLDCPVGKVLVGFSIAEQHTSPTYTPDYTVITSISGMCADLAMDINGAIPGLLWKNATNIGPLKGAFYSSASATTKSLTLDTNQIAVGYQGASGIWVDRIGPILSSVQIVLQ